MQIVISIGLAKDVEAAMKLLESASIVDVLVTLNCEFDIVVKAYDIERR